MYNRTLHGTIKTLSVESALLQGNPLGDPHVRSLPVYLPPGYEDGSERYPVIYALAGFTGTGLNMTGFSIWEENIPEQLDDLIMNGGCPPAIIAMPDCFTRLGGCQYVNSTATGPYEDHLVRELIPLVDRELRTLADREHRGVAGKSSGGYGALTLGMKHPDLFAALACHSGDMYFEYSYLRDFPKAVDTLNQYGGVDGFLEAFDSATKKGSLIPALNIVAMAAAYSPEGTDIRLPFKLPSGELLPEVWQQWLEYDPVQLVERVEYIAALRNLDLLYIDVGEKDEFALHLGARIFIDRLKVLEIPYHYEEFNDGHFGINYRYKVSLELLAKTLGSSS